MCFPSKQILSLTCAVATHYLDDNAITPDSTIEENTKSTEREVEIAREESIQKALEMMREMRSKTRGSVRPQYVTVGNVGNFHNDRLIVGVKSGVSDQFPELSDHYLWASLKPSLRPSGGPSPLVGCNLYMSYVVQSQLKKTHPTLTQKLSVVPSLLDTLLLSNSNQQDRLAATKKLKLVFKNAGDALEHCRNCHRLHDRKSVRLEFTLATTLPARKDWMDGFLQDTGFDLASFVKVADSYDMYAFVDYVYQKHWMPLKRLLHVPVQDVPVVSHLSPAERTALMLHAEIIAKFFSPSYFKSPILDNIHRRGESQEPLHIPMSCLREPSQTALESMGMLYGVDPKLHPSVSILRHSAPIDQTRTSQRAQFTSISVAGKVRLQHRYQEVTGYIVDRLKRHALLGEHAVTDSNDLVIGRYEVVPMESLARLSRQSRLNLLQTCCIAVWELYFDIWKIRLNNVLENKNLTPLRSAPRNTSELAELDAQQANHVRLVRQSDRSKNKAELTSLTHPGAFFFYFWAALVGRHLRFFSYFFQKS